MDSQKGNKEMERTTGIQFCELVKVNINVIKNREQTRALAVSCPVFPLHNLRFTFYHTFHPSNAFLATNIFQPLSLSLCVERDLQ